MIGLVTGFVVALCALLYGVLRQRRRHARVVGRIALVGLTWTGAAGLLEVALWLRGDVDRYRIEPVEGSASADALIPDPVLKWRHAPGFRGRFTHPDFAGEPFEVNARGYRDVDWPTAPAADEFRVLVLGDSLTVGLGVRREETFCALLQKTLAARTTRTVRVLNAGVSGYGPGEEAFVLHELAEELRPNLVIAAFYDGNDLEDVRTAAFNARKAVGNPNLLATELAGAGRFRSTFLWDRREPDAGWQLPTLKWRHVLGRRAAQFVGDRVRQLRVRWFGAAPAAVYNDTMLASMLTVDRSPILDENYAMCVVAMRWMDARAKFAGARFLCVRLPSQLQVDPEQWERLIERLALPRDQFDVTLPGRRLVEDLVREGIAAVDAAAALAHGPGKSRSYFPEGHPNRAGHARIAALLDSVIGESLPKE